ncbi:MAG: metallophosphoesterase [Pseudomonadota bacterium]|nr:serine/threonine protein phosphatase [Pseudomonadales bacterium]MDY6921397.1 metallophosphoesterase [Pseudomonadota bacterium]
MVDEPWIEGYDVIGDVHGCADSLERLLTRLGYHPAADCWRHPRRKAVFVGDIIDRGPQIRRAMRLVRAMVDRGQAYLVLGNHEYNAVIYSLPTQAAVPEPLRRYYRRLRYQLHATLEDYRLHLEEWRDLIHWLRERPIFLEFPHFRVVHACWDPRRIAQAAACHEGRVLQDDEFLAQSVIPATEPNRVVERLLKGTDLALPAGKTLVGSDGVRRSRFRTKFWSGSPQTYGDVVFQPDALPAELASQPLSAAERQRLLQYDRDQKVLFVGHYWCQGLPRIIHENIACLDYSAVKHGLLVAYRMGPEQRLNNEQFVWVQSNPP